MEEIKSVFRVHDNNLINFHHTLQDIYNNIIKNNYAPKIITAKAKYITTPSNLAKLKGQHLKE